LTKLTRILVKKMVPLILLKNWVYLLYFFISFYLINARYKVN
jgi:hypothetical protein